MIKIKSCGAAKVVTGSCHLITLDNKKILIDCGMFQGSKELTRKNYEEFLFDPAEIDFVIITHAHIDHSGLLPKLVNRGFVGTIYTSSASADLIPIMLEDSAHIQEMDTEHENKRRKRQGLEPREPLYRKDDVYKCVELIKSVNYDQEINPCNNISFIMRDAGHIIGSSIIELFIKDASENKKLVFSGDIGQWDVPIIEDPTFIEEADYVWMESTYGNRLHKDKAEASRDDILLDIINKTYKKGGKVLIPSFAIERTQEIIYSINKMVKKGIFPPIDVYVDSPLAIRATKVFIDHTEIYDKEAREEYPNPFSFENLKFTLKTEESMELNKLEGPAVIIAGSGMCTAGRIRHHLKHGLWDKKNTVVFVGYQAGGTLGRIILDGVEEIKMMGIKVKVGAEIKKINSFSAHADYSELLKWIDGFKNKPKKIFLVHGEPDSLEALSSKISEKNIKTYIPEIGEEIIL